jgi:hypothetical protein
MMVEKRYLPLAFWIVGKPECMVRRSVASEK